MSEVVKLLVAVGAASLLGLVPPLPAAASEFGFSVKVDLSPAAAERLAALGETITVWTLWHGQPTAAARKHADREGKIDLATEDVSLPGTGGIAVVTGRNVDPRHVARIRDRDVRVDVDVVSAARKHPYNLLACTVLGGSLAKLPPSPIPIHCRLIEEH